MLEKEEIESSILRMKEAAREGQPVRADVYLIHVNYLEHRLELSKAREDMYKGQQTQLATMEIKPNPNMPSFGQGSQVTSAIWPKFPNK